MGHAHQPPAVGCPARRVAKGPVGCEWGRPVSQRERLVLAQNTHAAGRSTPTPRAKSEPPPFCRIASRQGCRPRVSSLAGPGSISARWTDARGSQLGTAVSEAEMAVQGAPTPPHRGSLTLPPARWLLGGMGGCEVVLAWRVRPRGSDARSLLLDHGFGSLGGASG